MVEKKSSIMIAENENILFWKANPQYIFLVWKGSAAPKLDFAMIL